MYKDLAVASTSTNVTISANFLDNSKVLAEADAVKNEVTTTGQDQQPMNDGTYN